MVGYSQPLGAAGCRAPTRGCRARPALLLAGAAAPTAPLQGGYPWARAVVACAGAATIPGLSPATSRAASRGGGAGRPLAGRLPTCKGSHRLGRGSDDDDNGGIVNVKEG
ncbi:hypothetical protein GW17_00039467 [Ensete ventricosum]|nr:hypothetical protein GW17_00039467 [Ensete ventricosum]